MNSPVRFLLFVLLVIVGVKASEQLYSLVAFRDERAQVRGVRDALAESGARIVETEARLKEMRAALQAEDVALERELRSLQRYYRQARGNALPAAIYDDYSVDLARYNAHVSQRNTMLAELDGVRDGYVADLRRYDQLADSIHALAVRMGEPYYQIPSPLEAATQVPRTAPR